MAGPKRKAKKGVKSSVQEKVVSDWARYFGPGDLPDWQRLMADLGFEEQFASKTQCRKALKGVWVNIVDFLDNVEAGCAPHRFPNSTQLAKYTRNSGKIYPKRHIQEKSPLRSLLAHIF
ncbi:hypothetical protein GGS23DRAFT_295013 [Durotheca rogersii]|uniref:uncharacterized protein n=1 Tax=Durotheca rogersii TaxID=419775 RepID=UPI00221FCBAC|nr:uncharacterized protein GGS23DRAFT_295013 [Durotheca rogersii]KAI5866901.1 hypothetical protein GGS23DRAFT_295013 [Durotheca rogersii]